ncbi:MAG: aminoglycoside phosphotransferase family protein [Bacteroidota bacterium]
MHLEHLQFLSQKVFAKHPDEVIRKTIGICNEVYELRYGSEGYILRMNTQKNLLYGTHKFLPLFKELKIKTPDIIAEDYTQTDLPFCYQILTKLPGQDLKLAIEDMSTTELKELAVDIAAIFDKFNSRPAQSDFGGLTGMHEESIPSMLAVVQNQRRGIWQSNRRFQVLEQVSFDRLDELINEHQDYFLQLVPKLYYDDMSAKNIMIHEGKFEGLVDLDFLRKGDYIEVLGAIKAVWYGKEHGRIYLDEIIRIQALNKTQQKLINLYAIIHLMMWTSEAGNAFNGNASTEINWRAVNISRAKILALYNEIKG